LLSYPKYASVVLDLAIDKPLDYGIPQTLIEKVKKGTRVEVPLRGKRQKGYVLEIKNAATFSKVLPILEVTSDSATLPEELLELALWISKYYASALSKVLRVVIPSVIKKEVDVKKQAYVARTKSRKEIMDACTKIRIKAPAQAAILDVMLKVQKQILLTELLERANCSRAPVTSLVKSGFLAIHSIRLDSNSLINEEYFRTQPKRLSDEQQKAFTHIKKGLEEKEFNAHLLYGVTGSGKTEIYLQAIAKTLQCGKGAIVLVPEISLISQIAERIRTRFEEPIAIFHHRLSEGERCEAWNRIKAGEINLVIGARSAVFSPVRQLGLIIVDEEHESSYKQEEEPCYHARDVAVMRARMVNASVILGSATPSFETYTNAVSGKYHLHQLLKRAEKSLTPRVIIVDMNEEFQNKQRFTNFSEPLLERIKQRSEKGEQTILFLNRRGYHTALFCNECQKPIRCSQCEMTLTFHLERNSLTCHLCGYTLSPPPRECPHCKKQELMKYRGVGTELLEKSLHAVFPEIRTLRIDADTTRHKGSHQTLLRAFGTGKADVLIGTQMVAKGLHFPEVTLVGVMNCDTALNIPDFRSSETVFQLITQVAGRAGRGVLPGEVIIQTRMPENSTIQYASKHDFFGFYKEEIVSREIFLFPPFSRLIKLVFSGKNEQKTLEAGHLFRNALLTTLTDDHQLSPLVPSGRAKVKNSYRFQCFIKGHSVYAMNQRIKGIRDSLCIPKNIKVLVDVNPVSIYF